MGHDSMDTLFRALAHPHRRRILDLLKEGPGCTVGELSGHFDTSRIAVMKHLRVLEEADLVVSEKEGRTRRLYFNVVPIQLVYDRWTSEYSALWAQRVTRLKFAVESRENDENGRN